MPPTSFDDLTPTPPALKGGRRSRGGPPLKVKIVKGKWTKPQPKPKGGKS